MIVEDLKGKTCAGRVWDGWRFHPCGRPAKTEENGEHFCGVHDPAKACARTAKRSAEAEARWARISAAEKIQKAEAEVVRVAMEWRKNANDTIGEGNLRLIETVDALLALRAQREA
jgi:hypothetical protein